MIENGERCALFSAPAMFNRWAELAPENSGPAADRDGLAWNLELVLPNSRELRPGLERGAHDLGLAPGENVAVREGGRGINELGLIKWPRWVD